MRPTVTASIDTRVGQKRKPAFYAYIGFICVRRNDCGEVRVELLTGRRFMQNSDER
jgi:hypothetical protein